MQFQPREIGDLVRDTAAGLNELKAMWAGHERHDVERFHSIEVRIEDVRKLLTGGDGKEPLPQRVAFLERQVSDEIALRKERQSEARARAWQLWLILIGVGVSILTSGASAVLALAMKR